MLIRIFLGIGQLVHVFTSLGALLLLAQDLVGSINVSPSTGRVLNFQDMGGGISSLFLVLGITAVVWVVVQVVWTRSGPARALLSHFLIVFGLKGALIWTIYFRDLFDPRILAAYPLEARHFLSDWIAMILSVIYLGFFAKQEEKPGR
jgi:uncharacterized membrane protein